MKNENGGIPPIILDIKDDRRFLLIALLVDRDDFREDIAEIRKKLGITSVPYVFPKYPYKLASVYVNLFKDKEACLEETIASLEDFCDENGLQNLSALDKTLGATITSADNLIKKYRKGSQYLPVVIASILIGTIHEEDFSPTQLLILDKKSLQRLLKEAQDNEQPIIAIQVGRESDPEEVKKTFSAVSTEFFGGREIINADGTGRIDYNPRFRTPDTISNIRRDREWYWKNKDYIGHKKIGYKKIWTASDPKDHTGDWEGVSKAIKQYRSRLRVET